VNLTQALVGLAVVGGIAFLFTTVAARAIAIVGTNPVSGMTLMTLIISSVALKAAGLEGEQGIVSALLIGGVVCTALSMSGGFISDLKIGYWLGTTPQVQQKWKFLGTIVAAISVTAVIMMLADAPGFSRDNPDALPAPQANAMAALIEPLMTGQPAPWLLYMAGIFMALILEWTGLPALAFALGMYLPLELNTPILAGGIVAHLVARGRKEETVAKRKERGTLMASGFVAGGAIMGVLAALIRFVGQKVWGEEAPEAASAAVAELAEGTEELEHLAEGAADYVGMAQSAVVKLEAHAHEVMAQVGTAAADSVRIVADGLSERVTALKGLAESAAVQADAKFIDLAGDLAARTEMAEAETWTPVKALGLEHWVEEEPASAVVALVLFFGLCTYLYRGGRSAASD